MRMRVRDVIGVSVNVMSVVCIVTVRRLSGAVRMRLARVMMAVGVS